MMIEPDDIVHFTDDKMELQMRVEAVIDDDFKNINLNELLKDPVGTLGKLYPHLAYEELCVVADDAYTLGIGLARKVRG